MKTMSYNVLHMFLCMSVRVLLVCQFLYVSIRKDVTVSKLSTPMAMLNVTDAIPEEASVTSRGGHRALFLHVLK